MGVKYNVLATKIFEKGIKKNAIAEALNITPRALNNKIYGISPFTWEQVCLIQRKFFPEFPKEEIFKINEQNNNYIN